MEVDIARVILNEAKSGGFMELDIPETDEEIIAEAEYYLEEAINASEAGMKHETIEAIIRLSEPQGGGSEYNPGYASGVPPKSSGGFSESDLRESVQSTGDPKGPVGAVGPTGSTGPARAYAIPAGLPIPRDYDDSLEDFPRDISELTDREVRRLSGVYNAYLSRAKWLLSIAISDLASTTHLRDHAYRVAIRNVDKVDSKTDKNKLKEVIDAEAREDDQFAKYDNAVLKHQNEVTQLKALAEIYGGNVDRLSREWTMRQDEYEKSR